MVEAELKDCGCSHCNYTCFSTLQIYARKGCCWPCFPPLLLQYSASNIQGSALREAQDKDAPTQVQSYQDGPEICELAMVVMDEIP